MEKHKEKMKKIDGGNSAAGRCENTAEIWRESVGRRGSSACVCECRGCSH